MADPADYDTLKAYFLTQPISQVEAARDTAAAIVTGGISSVGSLGQSATMDMATAKVTLRAALDALAILKPAACPAGQTLPLPTGPSGHIFRFTGSILSP